MSVDERLREAFGQQDRAWDALAPGALHDLTTRHRRGVAVRRGAAVGLVVAAAAAVAVGVAVTSQPAGRTAPDPTTSVSPAPAAVLAGRWRSEPVTTAVIRETLREAGWEEYADDVLAELPGRPFRVVITVTGDDLDLDLVSGGRTSRWDEETLSVRDGSLVLRPRLGAQPGAARSVHRWVATGGTLRLTYVTTEEGFVGGIPGEVWQRVLYDIATFRR